MGAADGGGGVAVAEGDDRGVEHAYGGAAGGGAGAALAIARQADPDIDRASALLDAVQSFTLGAVQRELAERRAERASGLTEDQWRNAVGPYLREALARGDYPHLEERIVNGAEPDNAERFAFGLDRVLDGLGAWLAAVRGR